MTTVTQVPTKEIIDPAYVLATIELALKDNPNAEIYGTAKGAAMDWHADLDGRKWSLGDLARLLGKRYGKDIIGTFAAEINMEKARLAEYRRTCAFWLKDDREALLMECRLLTYTHLRDAMRLKDLNDARAFLLRANDNEWNVEQARIELDKLLGKPVPPLTLLDFSTLNYRYDAATRTMTIGIPAHVDLTSFHKHAKAKNAVRFTLKEDIE
jgi:hypothetical protein